MMTLKEVRLLVEKSCSHIPLVTYETRSFDNWAWGGPTGLILDEELELAKAIGRFGGFNFNMHLPFLYLYGITGVGKTHLALALAWGRVMLGYQVLFYQVETLLDELKAGFSGESREFDKLLYRAKNCYLLVLDDIGSEKQTEWGVAKLDSIIDYRYLELKETIFTSNFPLDYVDKATQEHVIPIRIADRCNEGMVIRVKGESHRRRK